MLPDEEKYGSFSYQQNNAKPGNYPSYFQRDISTMVAAAMKGESVLLLLC